MALAGHVSHKMALRCIHHKCGIFDGLHFLVLELTTDAHRFCNRGLSSYRQCHGMPAQGGACHLLPCYFHEVRRILMRNRFDDLLRHL